MEASSNSRNEKFLTVGRYQVAQFLICFLSIMFSIAQLSQSQFLKQSLPFFCDGTYMENLDACPKSKVCSQLKFMSGEVTHITQFQMVCSNSYKLAIIMFLNYSGFIVGGLYYGYLTDRKGRTRVCLYCGLLVCICGIVSILLSKFWIFGLFRFLNMVGAAGQTNVVFIYGFENVPSNRRMVVLFAFILAHSCGQICVGVAHFFASSHILMDVVFPLTSLFCVAISTYFYDSPSWLLAVGKIDKAKYVFESIAKSNRKSLNISSEIQPSTILSQIHERTSGGILKRACLELRDTACVRRIFVLLLIIYILLGSAHNIATIHLHEFYPFSKLATNFLVKAFSLNLCMLIFLLIVVKCSRMTCMVSIFIILTITSLSANIFATVKKFQMLNYFVAIGIESSIVFALYLLIFIVMEMFPTTHRGCFIGFYVATFDSARFLTEFFESKLSFGYYSYSIIAVFFIVIIITACFLPNTKRQIWCESFEEMVLICNDRFFFRDFLKVRESLSSHEQKSSSLTKENSRTTTDTVS